MNCENCDKKISLIKPYWTYKDIKAINIYCTDCVYIKKKNDN